MKTAILRMMELGGSLETTIKEKQLERQLQFRKDSCVCDLTDGWFVFSSAVAPVKDDMEAIQENVFVEEDEEDKSFHSAA